MGLEDKSWRWSKQGSERTEKAKAESKRPPTIVVFPDNVGPTLHTHRNANVMARENQEDHGHRKARSIESARCIVQLRRCIRLASGMRRRQRPCELTKASFPAAAAARCSAKATQYAAKGQLPQRGDCGVHTVAPSSINA
eukprot:87604-Pleurochrysis_carterae.AAC.2